MPSGSRQGWRTRSWVINPAQLGKLPSGRSVPLPAAPRRGPAPWIWSALLSATAALLCTVPLFNVLGYEFSFALCPLTAVAGLHLGIRAVRIARGAHAARADEWQVWSYAEMRLPGWAAFDLWTTGASTALLTLVPPLLLGLLNALRVRNCDLLSGVLFFALLPAVTAIVASGVGTAAALWVGERTVGKPPKGDETEVGPRRKSRTGWAMLLGLVGLLVAVGCTVARFYKAPPVFLYDPVMGYFPGALYDEDVRVGGPLLWARLYHFVWIAALVGLAGLWLKPTELRVGLPSPRRLNERPGTAAAVATFIIVGLGLHWLAPTCGFRLSGDDIAEQLGGVRETAHFVLVYDRRLSTAEVELVALDHELRWSQLDRQLGIHPYGKIRSYLFADSGSKRRLMGAEQTFVAKPWRKEIYLQWEPFPHRVLKHELAHVFAGAFGDRRFGITWRAQPLDELVSPRAPGWLKGLLRRVAPPVPNMGLVEGVAVAAAWSPDDRLSVHGWARAMVEAKLDLPLDALLGLGFYRSAAQRSYTLVGSFCRYLLDTYGAGKLRALYWLGGDFSAVYHRQRFELEREWRGYLASLKVADEDLAVARERFGQRSIFARPCAHALARRRKEAEAALARGDARMAAELFGDICNEDGGDPRNGLALARAQFRADLPHEAAHLLDGIATTRDVTAPVAAEALLLGGDAAYFREDYRGALRRWSRAVARPATSAERRAALARLAALKEPDIGARLVRAVAHDPTRAAPDGGVGTVDLLHLSEVVGTHPASGLALYLLGRQLMALDAWTDALPYLDRAVQAGLPDQLFYIEALRSIGRAAYIAHDNVRSRHAWKQLSALPFLPEGVLIEAADWLDRLDRDEAIRKALHARR